MGSDVLISILCVCLETVYCGFQDFFLTHRSLKKKKKDTHTFSMYGKTDRSHFSKSRAGSRALLTGRPPHSP